MSYLFTDKQSSKPQRLWDQVKPKPHTRNFVRDGDKRQLWAMKRAVMGPDHLFLLLDDSVLEI